MSMSLPLFILRTTIAWPLAICLSVTGASLVVSVPANAAPPAPGTRLDCARATSNIERSICGDPELSVYDRALNAVYRLTGPGRLPKLPEETYRRRQRAWLVERDTCADRACLLKKYRDQLEDLFEDVSDKKYDYRRSGKTGDLAMIDLGGMDYAYRLHAFYQGRMPGAVNVGSTSGIIHLSPVTGLLAGSSTNDGCVVRIAGTPEKGWGVDTVKDSNCRVGHDVTLGGFYRRR